MPASPRTPLALSLMPPLFGVLSIAVPLTLLFHAADAIVPERNLIDDPPAFNMADFEFAFRSSAAIILASSLVTLAVVTVFVVDAARTPDIHGTKLALWILLLIFAWPVGTFI